MMRRDYPAKARSPVVARAVVPFRAAARSSRSNHGLHGSGAMSPALVQIGTIRASAVMRPITASLCR